MKLALNSPWWLDASSHSPTEPSLQEEAIVRTGWPWGWSGGNDQGHPPVCETGTKDSRVGTSPGAVEGAMVGLSLAGDVHVLLTWQGQGLRVCAGLRTMLHTCMAWARLPHSWAPLSPTRPYLMQLHWISADL